MAGAKKNARKRGGFTLLELLVILLIITIAVALLYPVFMQVRERGRQSLCSSHVSQHARAVLMYAQDYDERLPVAWNWFGPGAGASPGEDLYPRWWNVLQPYLKNDEVFRCPSDAGYLGMRPGDRFNSQPFFPDTGSSYSSFIGWLPSSDVSLPSHWPHSPGGLGGISLASLLSPNGSALSYDTWPFWHAALRDELLAAATDNVLLNVSFLDGSVRRRSYRYVTTYLVQGPAAADGEFRLVLGDQPDHRATDGGHVAASSGTNWVGFDNRLQTGGGTTGLGTTGGGVAIGGTTGGGVAIGGTTGGVVLDSSPGVVGH